MADDNDTQRTEQINIRMSKNELKELQTLCNFVAQPMSDYVRYLIRREAVRLKINEEMKGLT